MADGRDGMAEIGETIHPQPRHRACQRHPMRRQPCTTPVARRHGRGQLRVSHYHSYEAVCRSSYVALFVALRGWGREVGPGRGCARGVMAPPISNTRTRSAARNLVRARVPARRCTPCSAAKNGP